MYDSIPDATINVREQLSMFYGYGVDQQNTNKEEGKPMGIRFIDLFAGIGGIRKGFEIACKALGMSSTCVFTSEIKPYAIEVLRQNHPGEIVHGDITQVLTDCIPDFDFLLAGFPCQAFSAAGKRLGFEDTRGTLFFEVARILKEKNPRGFILENVEGLVNHDKDKPSDKVGRTLSVIIQTLEGLGYKVSWKVLNAKNFGVPQDRRRIYIVGTRDEHPDLESFKHSPLCLDKVLQTGLPISDSDFVRLVLKHYPLSALYGKSIKDKRGGENNIHSWDIEYKGAVSSEQRELLNLMLKERRKKKWAEEYGIDWMDGMPLTIEHIRTFYEHRDLEGMLADLVNKGYLKMEYPKMRVGKGRVQDTNLPLGYNIVSGKMSFEINKVLDPHNIAPTLVAMDMQHLFVVDGDGLRTLSLREGLRLFGFPDDFKFDVSLENGYDLLGNTVVVPVISAVAARVLNIYYRGETDEVYSTGSL
ncbi:MAG: DNA cytosine methyltransferase [Oscillospiraceae bacterium]|nr:DNA cytosine methyltransferase [Oscillospiraceae bacterium]MCL2126013.1 DNA cytosine methyltransferase [Oscillospiraceae bacterium]